MANDRKENSQNLRGCVRYEGEEIHGCSKGKMKAETKRRRNIVQKQINKSSHEILFYK